MNFIIWLVVGGLIGWVASMIMRTDAQQGVILNVVVGIVGAFIGGLLLAVRSGNNQPQRLQRGGTGRVPSGCRDASCHRQFGSSGAGEVIRR